MGARKALTRKKTDNSVGVVLIADANPGFENFCLGAPRGATLTTQRLQPQIAG